MTQIYRNENALPEIGVQLEDLFRGVMKHVYLWMFLGLAVTAATSFAFLYTPLISLLVASLQTPIIFYGLLIGEVGLVWWLSARVFKLSIGAARTGFLVYALLNGFTMCAIFLVYTEASIVATFVTSSLVFAAMSILGYTTQMNLSKMGGYLFMGLIGLIIGSVANMFFASTTLDWILTYAGVALFIGLTVYDSQRIKHMVAQAMESGDEGMLQRMGLLGALRLYLDFINLFLYMLRLFGRRK